MAISSKAGAGRGTVNPSVRKRAVDEAANRVMDNIQGKVDADAAVQSANYTEYPFDEKKRQERNASMNVAEEAQERAAARLKKEDSFKKGGSVKPRGWGVARHKGK